MWLSDYSREIVMQRQSRTKNFVQRLDEVPGLVATYLTTDTIKWETRDVGTALTVRIMGKTHITRHMEFHRTGHRAFYLFALPEDEMRGGFALFVCTTHPHARLFSSMLPWNFVHGYLVIALTMLFASYVPSMLPWIFIRGCLVIALMV